MQETCSTLLKIPLGVREWVPLSILAWEFHMDCLVHNLRVRHLTEWLSLHKASREMLQGPGFTLIAPKPPERTGLLFQLQLSDCYPLPPASPSFPWNNWRQNQTVQRHHLFNGKGNHVKAKVRKWPRLHTHVIKENVSISRSNAQSN